MNELERYPENMLDYRHRGTVILSYRKILAGSYHPELGAFDHGLELNRIKPSRSRRSDGLILEIKALLGYRIVKEPVYAAPAFVLIKVYAFHIEDMLHTMPAFITEKGYHPF